MLKTFCMVLTVLTLVFAQILSNYIGSAFGLDKNNLIEEKALNFPVLPSDWISYGDNICVNDGIREFGNQNNSDYISGMVLDSNLNEQAVTYPYSFFGDYYAENDSLKFSLPFYYLSKEGVGVYLYDKDYKTISSTPRLLCDYSSRNMKPLLFMGPNVGYSPVGEVYIRLSQVDEKHKFFELFDKTTLKRIYSLNKPQEYITLAFISNRYLCLITEEVNQLVDFRFDKNMLKLEGNYIANQKYFITNHSIFSLTENKIISDVTKLNLAPRKIKDKYYECYIQPEPGDPDNSMPTIYRIGFDGAIVEKISLKSSWKHLIYTLFDTHDNVALCMSVSPGEAVRKSYQLLDIRTGQSYYEFLPPNGETGYAMIVGTKAIFFWQEGAVIYNMDQLKIEKTINFPYSPIFLTENDKKLIVLPLYNPITNSVSRVAYQLDEGNQIFLHTETFLPFCGNYVLEDNKIYSFDVKSNLLEDGNYSTTFTINISYIASNKPYMKRVIGIGTNKHKEILGYKIKKGKLYAIKDFGEIVVYDLDSYWPALGDWVMKKTPPGGLSEKEALIEVSNGMIYTLYPGTTNWFLCYDEQTGREVFDIQFEAQRWPWSKNNAIYVFEKSIVIKNPPCVLYLTEGKVVQGGEFLLGVSYPYAFFESKTDKGKQGITKIDINTGESANIEIDDTFLLGKQDECNSVIRNCFFNSQGGVIDSKGNVVQTSLGKNLIKYKEYENNIIMKTGYFDSENSTGSLIKFSPCPSFSLKRLDDKDTDNGDGVGDGIHNGVGNGGDGNSNDEGISPSSPSSTPTSPTVSFDLTMTRDDGLADVLRGEAYIAAWGDDGKAPIFTKLNGERVRIGPLLPGMKQTITLKLPEGSGTGNVGGSVLNGDGSKSEGKYFALIIESNGLLDTGKSELLEFDREGRPLYDGTPLSLDRQHAMVVSVWGR